MCWFLEWRYASKRRLLFLLTVNPLREFIRLDSPQLIEIGGNAEIKISSSSFVRRWASYEGFHKYTTY